MIIQNDMEKLISGSLGINTNHRVQGHEIQNPNLSRDLFLENASSNQINSLVSLIFLLKMMGGRTNSKQYYQKYCEEAYGNLDSVSCLQKLAQDLKNNGLHFSDTIELLDGGINHFRTRRSPRFRIKIPSFKAPKRPKFPRNTRPKGKNPRTKHPSKNDAGTGSSYSQYFNKLSKESRDILNKLNKKKPKQKIPSKPSSKKTKWDEVMKNRNQGKCAKNRCIDQDDSSKPKPNKADTYGELGTQIFPQLGDLLPSGSSSSIGKHSGTKSSGHLRDIEHQKWDITKIKNFGTNINPPNGGKNVNGDVNIHKGNLPKENMGGSRPSLISRVKSNYLCNGHLNSHLSRFKRSNNRCPPKQKKGQKKPEVAKSNSPNPQQLKKDDPSSSSNNRPDIKNPSHQGNAQQVKEKAPQSKKQPGSKGDQKDRNVGPSNNHNGEKYEGGGAGDWHVHQFNKGESHIKLGPTTTYTLYQGASNAENYKTANEAYKHLLRLRKSGLKIDNYYQLKRAIGDKKRQYRTLPGANN